MRNVVIACPPTPRNGPEVFAKTSGQEQYVSSCHLSPSMPQLARSHSLRVTPATSADIEAAEVFMELFLTAIILHHKGPHRRKRDAESEQDQQRRNDEDSDCEDSEFSQDPLHFPPPQHFFDFRPLPHAQGALRSVRSEPRIGSRHPPGLTTFSRSASSLCRIFI